MPGKLVEGFDTCGDTCVDGCNAVTPGNCIVFVYLPPLNLQYVTVAKEVLL